MPSSIAAIHLPEALRSGNSALVKLAAKIDSFSLVLWQTPESQLKRRIEKDYRAMVFTTRREVRKYCPKYRYFPGEGILDFSTDCASGQLKPGDLGKPPQPKRGKLCHQCCFFLGEQEEHLSQTAIGKALETLPESFAPDATSLTEGTKLPNEEALSCHRSLPARSL